MSLAGGLRELLRPPPHRGPLIAAGGVALAVGVALTVMRLGDGLPRAVTVAILLASGGLLYWLGIQAPNEDGRPPAYQSVLIATSFPLLYIALITLGAGYGDPEPGTLLWVSAVVGALALWPAFERNSAISLLIAAILGGVVLISTSNVMFDSASNVLIALYALALVLCGLALREPARRHAEVLIDAAGLAIAWIAASPFLLDEGGLPVVWQVVVLGAGFGLVAFGAVDRSPGPAYLGVVNLVLFILEAEQDDDLLWWPLILLAGGVAMLAAGLRPRRPLPPEPDPYRAGEAPLAARVDEDEIVVRVRKD
jgi:MFS family permease